MTFEKRLEKIERLAPSDQAASRLIIVWACPDDPGLFNFNDTRMTKAEVLQAATPDDTIILVVREPRSPSEEEADY